MRDTRRTRLVLSILLIAALALITLDYRDGSAAPLRGLRQFGGSVFGSAERGFAAVTQPVIRFFGGSAGGRPCPPGPPPGTPVPQLPAHPPPVPASPAPHARPAPPPRG